MNEFSSTELDRMRDTQDAAMQDACDLLIYGVTGMDSHGMPIEGYVLQATSACGLDLRASREMLNAEMHVYDARLRLPIGTVISNVDRVRVTHRFGEMQETPIEFDLIGEVRKGPSGLLVNLRNV